MQTLFDFDFNGRTALRTLVENSEYSSLSQIIASLSIFSHPETVRQTGCGPIIHVIRNADKRGSIEQIDGRSVGLDDNKSPTDVFLWCNKIKNKITDLQFNHIYPDSQNEQNYTCLANLCLTPAFLAKLTDSDADTRLLLRFRSFDLYGWHPADVDRPTRPANYEKITWGPLLPPVSQVADVFKETLSRRPRDRTTVFAQKLGHVFNNFTPK